MKIKKTESNPQGGKGSKPNFKFDKVDSKTKSLINKKLKEINIDHYEYRMLNRGYDAAVLGVNPITNSCVYSLYDMVDIIMKEMELDENFIKIESKEDKFNYCLKIVLQIFLIEETKGYGYPTLLDLFQ